MTLLAPPPALDPSEPESDSPSARRPAVERRLIGDRASGQRKDIQGLRALAVVAVVADHLLQRPSGGFLGVDVFFVISGFLITGLLLREHGRSGQIDLLAFYRRRIKRTVPVAWVVLVVSCVVGSLTLTIYQVDRLMEGAAAAATFWSNWQLIQVGADYLHATDAPTAVQHYWSLAVEEQFYLLWPAVILGGLMVDTRFRRRRGAVAVASLLALAIASVLWAAHETSAHPTAAYFSTFTRGWELLAGAGLAFAAPLLERIPASMRPALAWSGLGLLVWGLATVTADSRFPYPWAFVAVAGTALVIAAGTGSHDTQVWPLTNRLSLSVGAVSYSIYLWHFPVIVFSSVFRPDGGMLVHAVELALIVMLSVLSYHLVEVPFRRASWRRPRLPLPGRRVLVGVGAGALAIVLLSGAVVMSRHQTVPPSVPVAKFFTSGTKADDARARSVVAALGATSWPALTPTDRQLGEGARVPEWTRDGCLNAFGPEETARRCVYGDRSAPRTLIVYGDSVALSYVPGLRAGLEGRGWRIEVLTSGQCPAVDVSVTTGDGTAYTACDEYHRFALARIAAEHPAVLVMVSSYLSLDRLASGQRDVQAGAEWATRTRDTVRRTARSAGAVVLLDAPPIEGSPQSCKTVVSSPQDCITGVQGNWLNAADSQRVGVAASGAENVFYPSTLPWFCSREGLCPSYVDGVVTLADGMHLTDAGSRQLAPLLRAAVERAESGTEPPR